MSAWLKFIWDGDGVIPGRREAANPESIRRSTGDMDSGFAAHSASKTRVNALMGRAPE